MVILSERFVCVGNCGMDLGLGLGAARKSGMGHLGYVVCLPGLGCLKVALEWGRVLGVWVSVSL